MRAPLFELVIIDVSFYRDKGKREAEEREEMNTE